VASREIASRTSKYKQQAHRLAQTGEQLLERIQTMEAEERSKLEAKRQIEATLASQGMSSGRPNSRSGPGKSYSAPTLCFTGYKG
jgi:septal ring factor EnvC (AmiA/AmiB activator)